MNTLEISNIQSAAAWIAANPQSGGPIIPAVQARFNLSLKQACDACALAQTIRRRDVQAR